LLLTRAPTSELPSQYQAGEIFFVSWKVLIFEIHWSTALAALKQFIEDNSGVYILHFDHFPSPFPLFEINFPPGVHRCSGGGGGAM